MWDMLVMKKSNDSHAISDLSTPEDHRHDMFACCFADPPQVLLQIGRTLVASDIKEGNDVYFDCQVQANPPITELTWYHEVSIDLASASQGDSWLSDQL